MEPEKTTPTLESFDKFENLKKVTSLSKYLAMTLFIIMPFIGGWIGYTYAPEKVIMNEKIVPVPVHGEKSATNSLSTTESNEAGLSWSVAVLEYVPFTMQYPQNWEFSCCGDTDSRSNYFFYKADTTRERKRADIVFTRYVVFDPEARLDVPSTLSESEQFELLKKSFEEKGNFIGSGKILDVISHIYLIDNEEVHAFLYKDKMYSVSFSDPYEALKEDFLQRILPIDGMNS